MDSSTAQPEAPADQINEETLAATLQSPSSPLKITHLSITDISGGCGSSFTATIVSPDFEGKSLLQRHRLVNGVLKEEIKRIHAWTPRCLSVGQWEKEKEKEKEGGT
jgi:stress-induced morphogen